MRWALREALGLSIYEAVAAEKRADRIEEMYRPDGAKVYVPITEDYHNWVDGGVKPLGPDAMKLIEKYISREALDHLQQVGS